jgi:hypothetical protein
MSLHTHVSTLFLPRMKQTTQLVKGWVVAYLYVYSPFPIWVKEILHKAIEMSKY